MAKKCVKPVCQDKAERSRERLLEQSSRRDGSAPVSVSEFCECIAERVEIGKDRNKCIANLQNESGVDCVLAGGAPVNEASGFWIFFGNKSGELFNQGNQKIGGICGGRGEGGEINEIGAAACGDGRSRGERNNSSLCLSTGEGRFKIE